MSKLLTHQTTFTPEEREAVATAARRMGITHGRHVKKVMMLLVNDYLKRTDPERMEIVERVGASIERKQP